MGYSAAPPNPEVASVKFHQFAFITSEEETEKIQKACSDFISIISPHYSVPIAIDVRPREQGRPFSCFYYYESDFKQTV